MIKRYRIDLLIVWLALILFLFLLIKIICYNINILNVYATVYEKFFIAFSGVASVTVATVAIIISLLTSRQQRELQLRQIKLESYELRYKCWNALSQIEFFLEIENKIFSCVETGRHFTLEQHKELINYVTSILEYSVVFSEIKFFVTRRERHFIDELQEDLKILCKNFFPGNYSRNIENRGLVKNILPKVREIRKNLEKDLNLVDIHKL